MQDTSTNTNNSTAARGAIKKVLIFITCYNDEKSIESVLERIPKDIWESNRFYTEILIIDDQSPDKTFYVADDFSRRHPQWNLTILYNPKSQGYGGNQKIGYCYAAKKGFDAVVLLHGNGRYAPEYLGQMLEPILTGQADAVLGSRMIHRLDALKGRMPLHKWLGNQLLTFIQNRILNCRLSEFHTGYRAYSVAALAAIPFEHNSDYFDFDTDIIIQLLDNHKRIREITVPTFYGNEISRVKGIRYAVRVIRSSILSRVMRLGIYYHPKFDYEPSSNYRYKEKFGYSSSQQFALDQVAGGSTVLDIGCGPGFMAKRLAQKNAKTVSIDLQIRTEAVENSWKCVETDVDKYEFNEDFGKVDYILALDIIEHLKSPERLLQILRQRFSRDIPNVIITTGNIAFFTLRIALLFDSFNYGKRGVLDMDHTRLFTFSTLQRTLEINGYDVVKKYGIPAPFPLAIGDRPLACFLLRVNRLLIFLSKSLFSYQIAVIAKPRPTLEHLLEDAHQGKNKKLNTGPAAEV
ncbi:MAG: glycosyltransferase [Planctomycetota bacterium]|nr:glycosyltransferase [Planctomycetota bacterium]